MKGQAVFENPTAPVRRSKVVLSLRERNEAWGEQNAAGNPGARVLAEAFCSISAERDGHFAGAPSRLLQQGFKHDLALLRGDVVLACLHSEVFEAAAADLIAFHDLALQ